MSSMTEGAGRINRDPAAPEWERADEGNPAAWWGPWSDVWTWELGPEAAHAVYDRHTPAVAHGAPLTGPFLPGIMEGGGL